MNEQDEQIEKDRRLLEEIEQIALQGDVDRQQEDSLFGFCAHLASTVPQAGREYQQRMDAQLVERWERLYKSESNKAVEQKYGHFQAWSHQHPEQPPYSSPTGNARRSSSSRTALAWAGLVLVSIVFFSLFFITPVRVLASQFIREVILGDYSSVQQLEWNNSNEMPVTTENRWMIETILGGSGGELPPGVDPTTRSFSSILEVQEHTELPLQEPGYLPEGFALREVKLPPEGAVEEQAFLFYSDLDREIVFFMGRIGELSGEAPGLATVKVSVIATNGSIEEVAVGEHPAAWIDGEMLAWEAGNILYEIGGGELSLDLALRIAESIP